jgi:hypothetical protein
VQELDSNILLNRIQESVFYMDRRPRKSLSLKVELQQLEAELAALTLQVAHLRHSANSPTNEQELRVGEEVTFQIAGRYA